MYLFLRERQTETAHKWERGREGGDRGSKVGSVLTAESPTRGSNSQLQDHDLSRSQTLNRLSHPGAPRLWFSNKDETSVVPPLTWTFPAQAEREVCSPQSGKGHQAVRSAFSPCKPAPGVAGAIPGTFVSFAPLSLTKPPSGCSPYRAVGG